MDERLFEIILALIPILGTILTVYVIPLLKERLGLEQLAKYKEWVMLAVKCAEMLWPQSGTGGDKKAYVVDFLNRMFNQNKTVITQEQLELLIEAAVLELNKGGSENVL